ncbi:MAG TPA: aldolase/citrate lyase family protein [Acidimicrobiia bacterium]
MSNATHLRELSRTFGFWCTTGDPAVVDAAASLGPDFICIDTQHGVDLGHLDASVFTVMASYGVAGLVRVDSVDLTPIGRALDLGAAGVIVPLVETADDAATAVHATRHAPRGGRSYGMQTRRLGPFDEEPFVMIQVETAGAVKDIQAIAAVDGVDGLYIGPADLGLGLGGVPAPDVNEVFEDSHPNAGILGDAFKAVVAAATANGIAPGLHCGDGASAARAFGEGFTFSAVASDLGLVGAGLREHLAIARK